MEKILAKNSNLFIIIFIFLLIIFYSPVLKQISVVFGYGGGGGGASPAPSPVPVIEIAPIVDQKTSWFIDEVKRTDIVRDGAIDIFDFNTLMVQWDSSGTANSADVNQDGLVDIFDFNLLMVHWGKTEIM
jgi:hypothetical protein